MNLELEGKVALVTAASRGLGKASALALAREGAQVVICARSEALEGAAAEIKAAGAAPLALRADVTAQADIDRVVDAAMAKFGRIDILVVHCGGPPPGGFLAPKPDAWAAAADLTPPSAVRPCVSGGPTRASQGQVI